MFPYMLLDTVVEQMLDTVQLKEYAKAEIVSESTLKEWKCFNELVYRESRWDHTAENGPFYGLGQMYDGKKYLEGEPLKQIDKTIEYIENKYQDSCAALSHHYQYNWY